MPKRLGMYCPHCGARAQVRTSIEQSPTMRNVYFLCTNLVCGHSWVSTLEAVRTIAPSGVPNPCVQLPIMARPEIEHIYDLINDSTQRRLFDEPL